MIIRAFEQSDIPELIRIHSAHFNFEFDISNFNHLIEQAFVVEKHGKIVCIGGIKTLAEAVLVTDLDKDDFTKVKALKESLKIFSYISRRTGHDSIHAFIQDDKWRNHLINQGFKNCKGNAIVLGV